MVSIAARVSARGSCPVDTFHLKPCQVPTPGPHPYQCLLPPVSYSLLLSTTHFPCSPSDGASVRHQLTTPLLCEVPAPTPGGGSHKRSVGTPTPGRVGLQSPIGAGPSIGRCGLCLLRQGPTSHATSVCFFCLFFVSVSGAMEGIAVCRVHPRHVVGPKLPQPARYKAVSKTASTIQSSIQDLPTLGPPRGHGSVASLIPPLWRPQEGRGDVGTLIWYFHTSRRMMHMGGPGRLSAWLLVRGIMVWLGTSGVADQISCIRQSAVCLPICLFLLDPRVLPVGLTVSPPPHT